MTPFVSLSTIGSLHAQQEFVQTEFKGFMIKCDHTSNPYYEVGLYGIVHTFSFWRMEDYYAVRCREFHLVQTETIRIAGIKHPPEDPADKGASIFGIPEIYRVISREGLRQFIGVVKFMAGSQSYCGR